MSENARRRAQLSPAKRKLLQRRLAERRRAQAAAGDGAHELSFAQERFWFLEQLEPGNPAHHIASRARLVGALDAGALEAALRGVVERHESLRTRFALEGDRPVQRVEPAPPLSLAPVDLTGLAGPALEEERRRRLDAVALTPFDLARGPLLRVQLLRLGPEHHELLCALHHVAADGLSTQLLANELAELYRARVTGAAPRLPELALQYRDHAARQRRALTPEVVERESAWWRACLDGLEPLELPADRPAGRGPDDWRLRGARTELELEPALWEALRGLARGAGATPYMALLAAFETLLARLTGRDAFAVGTTAAGRTRAELRPLIGLFMNSVAVPADLAGNPSFRDLLGRVRAATLEAQRRQEFPFEKVVDALQPERSLERSPLFQVLFNYIDFIDFRRELPGLALELELARTGAPYDLALHAWDRGDGGLLLELEYHAGRFEAATAERFLAGLRRLVQAAVREPERPVGRLPWVGARDAEQLLRLGTGPPGVPWEGPVPAVPVHAVPVHAVIGARARHPARRRCSPASCN